MNPDQSTEARRAYALVIAALGVVYGDIGTSPLYAFRESLSGAHGIGTSPEAVLGVLSMIFWAVTIVISLKYVLLVLMSPYTTPSAAMTSAYARRASVY
jgi:KUP system potassium uptake protein